MAYTVNGRTEHAVAERGPKYSVPEEEYDITTQQGLLRRVITRHYFGMRFQKRPAEKNLSA
jgi:hypothetical protein